MPLDKDHAASKLQVIVRDPPIDIPGPEDIVIDHATSVAFVASQQRMSASGELLKAEDIPGGSIFALDLTGTPLAKRLLADQASLSFPFHPRGCSFFAGTKGERRLMVISDRTAADHVVEIFDVVGEAFDAVGLRHVRTIVDADHIVSPNDLVALDGDRFYVANDHGARNVLLRSLEDLYGLPTGETISASSVAAVHGTGSVRRLLIGQPFGNFLLDCELRSP
jgi:hypothetical protein